ncbi:DUF3306 domain-containing protein [Sulfitobacter sp. G21635-S1]|uniref:DUF3306 domain-containing protein n=1 Tax=Sulfitobacter sp. G21635-S1 TaxID=3014043 RepID=UPI0022AF8D14|nr:DUF3306 domain-containing protein [Sulfitobacter sp. G21635-S1]MCZ4254106.1 DUF3306 domain-containing protein [Sulfitobacter sp. G21635-S1]
MSGFWDRRRAAVAAEAQAEVAAAQEQAAQAQEASLAARDDDELLAELELPAPEDLVDGEQLRAFLRAQLPQRLKRRALRAFWRSNPVLACLDGLNDYDDDYTAAATAGKAVNTLYQVGKGFAAPLTEVLDGIALEEEPEGEAAFAAPVDTLSVPDVVPPAATSPVATEVQALGDQDEPDDMVDSPAPVLRRMRFSFAADAESTGV